jgi:hypothetical protein
VTIATIQWHLAPFSTSTETRESKRFSQYEKRNVNKKSVKQILPDGLENGKWKKKWKLEAG